MNKNNIKNIDVVGVVKEGFCIGCGACSVESNAVKIVFNQYGELVADIENCNVAELKSMDNVCPFSDSASNETELARKVFKNEKNIDLGDEIGFFTGLYAGYSESYRSKGSSGGVVSWLLSELLINKKVDKVIVVGKTDGDDRFFDFKVIDKVEEIGATGTSFYYPVSYDKVLQYVVDNPGRYAITGVPCFHKALRLLKATNPIIAERIVYQIGIVCGQMKSTFYLDYLARKSGISSPLVNACFRRKDEMSRADDYLFEGSFKHPTGEIEKLSVRNREVGANWGMGLFKPRACDFCDDVFAETADIAVMDAWLDKYINDGKGTSLVITRTAELQATLENGKVCGALQLEPVLEKDVVESQLGGLNHRRAGLRYRLYLERPQGLVPSKRIHSENSLDIWFKIEQRIRLMVREKSRRAMRKQLDSGLAGLGVYDSKMAVVLGLYRWFGRVKRRIAPKNDYRSKFKLDV
jgi:coenzyme F420-reducing hydrogenase beta subunit